ncbi:MAG: NAD-dependent epimerase/dehydratase family protein [Cyclobacteriaceae bacterium]|nr:NAD-dependent epimerase/dehydratase family protein [Cyclobacteriaceae bacterium SS2]
MKIIVIGGTGHIGTFLIPRLVKKGHEIMCVSRQLGMPYHADESWKSVKHITIDRNASEGQGDFGKQIKDLDGDVVIDLICFTPESAKMIAESLQDSIKHFLHCGTMWVHGHSEAVPTREDQPRKPFGEYGILKAEIEAYFLDQYNSSGFPVTILHPGHISGPGWLPINPAGHLDPNVFIKLANEEEVILPNLGMETVHHVHADDVALAFELAIDNPKKSIGESFHVVSEQALTLRGYAIAVAGWFNKEANLKFLPFDQWKETVTERDAELTWDHIAHSPNGSIEKARQLIGYQPNYSSLDAVKEAIKYHFDKENLPYRL